MEYMIMLGNIKTIIVTIAVGMAFMTVAYLYVANLKDNIKTLEVDLGLANNAIVTKNGELQFAEESAEKSKARSKVLSVELKHSNAAVEDMRTLFADHDFQKLVEAKPAMITKRMINATKKVFQELEDASR